MWSNPITFQVGIQESERGIDLPEVTQSVLAEARVGHMSSASKLNFSQKHLAHGKGLQEEASGIVPN